MSEICDACPYANEIQNLRRDADQHANKITECEKQIIIMQERFNNLTLGQKDIKQIVEEIRDKPAKRWDTVSMNALTTIMGIVIGYLINSMF